MMFTQQQITFGEQLKQQGIEQAINHADSIPPFNWSDKAYNFLTSWLGTVPVGYSFMAEDVRVLAEKRNVVPVPPSKRSWGAILLKARKEGLIISNGINVVKNPQAHRCFATLWIKI